MKYIKISKKEGKRYLPKIWNISFMQKDDFFVTPFGGSEKRYRTIFKEENGKLVIYFHSTKEELQDNIDLSSKPETIYMFGAYNQIEVCQMRSHGKIREMTEKETNEFVKIIKGRFNGKKQIDPDPKYCPNSKGLNYDEKQAGLVAINSEGKFFRFDPISYGYNLYERG